MENPRHDLTGAARRVQLLKIEGFSATLASKACVKSAWSVDGYEWEIRICPAKINWIPPGRVLLLVRLELVFLGKPRVCRAFLACRLVDPSGELEPAEEKTLLYDPQSHTNHVWLVVVGRHEQELVASGYLKDDTLTVQCAITLLEELPEPTIAGKEVTVPFCTLNQHLGELLQTGTGADVTFLVSGESFSVHKSILAARSSVFMAEFFGDGDNKEECSGGVEIKDMEAAVFKAMLGFIYTDTVPEFEKQEEAVTVMAQRLFAAADRFGLDRLKLICVGKLSGSISINTVATTLALAEQHRCSELKAKCVEFILDTPAILDALLAMDGYKHLESSCPFVVIDLLKAARGKKI